MRTQYFVTTYTNGAFGRLFYKKTGKKVVGKWEFKDNKWTEIYNGVAGIRDGLRSNNIVKVPAAEAALLFGEL
jgi:hypothetical protein